MSTKAQDIFNDAMLILDNQNEMGEADTSDNTDYRLRTPAILNLLIPVLYPYSDNYEVETAGKRPVAAVIQSMSDAIPLDDVLARSVLPLGLRICSS